MKTSRTVARSLTFAAALSLAITISLHATNYYWDANGETAGTGGAGVWDTASALWRSGSASGTLSTWPNTDPGNTDYAIIDGTSGNVTLNSDSQDIHFNKLKLNSGSILAPANGTARLNLSGTDPTIDVAQYKTYSVLAAITGSSLTKTSAGQLALRGDNSHTDGTYLKGGSIAIGHVNAFGPGTLYLQGGSLTVISGTGSPITNAVVVDATFGFGNNNFTGYGDALTLSGPVLLTGSRQISINILGVTINGVISDGGNGYGLTYVPGQYNDSLTLGGDNTFSGGVTFNDNGKGTLNIRHMGALGTGTLTLNGTNGKLNNTSGADDTLLHNIAQVWNGDFTFVGTKSLNMGSGSVSLGTAAGTLRTVTVNASTLTVGGAIADGTTATALRKIGGGTLALAGENAYTGGTTVTNGTVSVEIGGTLGTGAVTVLPKGKVVLKHSATIDDDAAVALTSQGSAYGKLELADGIVENVGSVSLDDTVYDAPGTSFGAEGTGATVQDSNFFSGTGILMITPLPPTVVVIR